MKRTAGDVLMFLCCIVCDVYVVFELRAIVASAPFSFMAATLASLFILFPAGMYLFSAPFQEKVDGIFKKLVKHRMLYRFVTFFALIMYLTYAAKSAAVLQGWTLLPLNIILNFIVVGSHNKPPEEQMKF